MYSVSINIVTDEDFGFNIGNKLEIGDKEFVVTKIDSLVYQMSNDYITKPETKIILSSTDDYQFTITSSNRLSIFDKIKQAEVVIVDNVVFKHRKGPDYMPPEFLDNIIIYDLVFDNGNTMIFTIKKFDNGN